MSLWAIKYPSGYVDPLSIRRRRKDSWENFERGMDAATENYRRKVRQWRKRGLMRAVRVQVLETTP